jgi:hypothetical protein
MPFLSAEDLVMFKMSFNREKDWVDIRNILEHTPDLDIGYIERQISGLRGPTMYPRLAALRNAARDGPKDLIRSTATRRTTSASVAFRPGGPASPRQDGRQEPSDRFRRLIEGASVSP